MPFFDAIIEAGWQDRVWQTGFCKGRGNPTRLQLRGKGPGRVSVVPAMLVRPPLCT